MMGNIRTAARLIAIRSPPVLLVKKLERSIIPAASRYGHAKRKKVITSSCIIMT